MPGANIEGTRHTPTCGQYRLAYEVYGSGPRVLVWLHGLLLDANLSRGLARKLAARGNRVVLLDLLGHGRSDKPRHAGLHRMDLYAKQVLCLMDELGVKSRTARPSERRAGPATAERPVWPCAQDQG